MLRMRRAMADRIDKEQIVCRLAKRMKTGEKVAESWIDAFTDTLFEAFKEGSGVTLPGFGGFYLEPRRDGCIQV